MNHILRSKSFAYKILRLDVEGKIITITGFESKTLLL